MGKFLKFGLAVLSLLIITACSTTSNLVKTEHITTAKHVAYSFADPQDDIKQNEAYFQAALNQKLKEKNIKLDQQNADTVLKYDFVFDEGNRALRYFVGFGAGKATGKFKVSIVNKADNNLLATVDTDASLSMRVFGGDAKQVLDNAAKDIAEKIDEANIFVK